jgi:RHS repeat-associated protein
VEPGKNTVRITAQDGRQNTKTQSYELTVPAVAPRVFTYDANGNTLSDGLRSYEWDAENRLARVRHGDGSATAFGYDGGGRRVWIEEKDAQGTVTSVRRYVWADGPQPAEERDGANAVLRRFYAEGEQAPGAAAPSDRLFYARDHLGSVREVTDAAGVLRARYDYGFWGNRTRVSGDVETAVGYTGHHHHGKSGLVLTWYRAYDPNTGRWLSRDPIAEEGGLNLYGYVGNDPIDWVDPFGLWEASMDTSIDHNSRPKTRPRTEMSAQMKGTCVCDPATGKWSPSIKLEGNASITGNWSGMDALDFPDYFGLGRGAAGAMAHEQFHALSLLMFLNDWGKRNNLDDFEKKGFSSKEACQNANKKLQAQFDAAFRNFLVTETGHGNYWPYLKNGQFPY